MNTNIFYIFGTAISTYFVTAGGKKTYTFHVDSLWFAIQQHI